MNEAVTGTTPNRKKSRPLVWDS